MLPPPEGEFVLPLFPLPNVVFFPRTRLPLHVFEPRYREMVQDALASDQRFGLILLRPGWEPDYFGAPAVHSTGTIATIEQSAPLDDGRLNIIVRGDGRFRILDEVQTAPYRVARVIAEPELETDTTRAYAQRQWLADLSQQYLTYLPDQIAVPEIDTVDLHSLTNALIMSLNLPPEGKQKLLEMSDLAARAEEVGNELTSRIESLKFLAPYRRGDPSRN